MSVRETLVHCMRLISTGWLMTNSAVQLKLHQEILAVIERQRTESGDASLGANIERLILDTQFQELEHEILDNPGAIEPWLLRRRRGE